MLDIPGYRVLGTIRATGSNVLFQAVREADGLPVILKTPLAPAPGSSESERYRRELDALGITGLAAPHKVVMVTDHDVIYGSARAAERGAAPLQPAPWPIRRLA
mgnify:CR=1 FL=1